MTLLVSVNKKRQLREFSRRLFFKTERSGSLLQPDADEHHHHDVGDDDDDNDDCHHVHDDGDDAIDNYSYRLSAFSTSDVIVIGMGKDIIIKGIKDCKTSTDSSMQEI